MKPKLNLIAATTKKRVELVTETIETHINQQSESEIVEPEHAKISHSQYDISEEPNELSKVESHLSMEIPMSTLYVPDLINDTSFIDDTLYEPLPVSVKFEVPNQSFTQPHLESLSKMNKNEEHLSNISATNYNYNESSIIETECQSSAITEESTQNNNEPPQIDRSKALNRPRFNLKQAVDKQKLSAEINETLTKSCETTVNIEPVSESTEKSISMKTPECREETPKSISKTIEFDQKQSIVKEPMNFTTNQVETIVVQESSEIQSQSTKLSEKIPDANLSRSRPRFNLSRAIQKQPTKSNQPPEIQTENSTEISEESQKYPEKSDASSKDSAPIPTSNVNPNTDETNSQPNECPKKVSDKSTEKQKPKFNLKRAVNKESNVMANINEILDPIVAIQQLPRSPEKMNGLQIATLTPAQPDGKIKSTPMRVRKMIKASPAVSSLSNDSKSPTSFSIKCSGTPTDSLCNELMPFDDRLSVTSKSRKRSSIHLKNFVAEPKGDPVNTDNLSLVSLIQQVPLLPPQSNRAEHARKKSRPDSSMQRDQSVNEEQQLATPKQNKFRLDLDGRIVFDDADNDSVASFDPNALEEVVQDANELTATYRSFGKRKLSGRRWSDEETKLFYQALMMVGTNFSAMASILETRSRDDLKKKFKVEEKRNGLTIQEILTNLRPWSVTPLKLDSSSTNKDKRSKKSVFKTSQTSSTNEVPKKKRKKFVLDPTKIDQTANILPDYLKKIMA